MTSLFAGTPFDIPPQCDHCGKLESECVCTAQDKADRESAKQRQADRLPPSQQTARISVQKRKGGRMVTVVEGLTAKANDLPSILTQLQAACGTGGTVKAKDDLIELQGDHQEKIVSEIKELGYRVKQ
ncbi:translation initiation factor Sui1 [Rubripirellula obstinata]|uniref:Translation initiation factor Sui1 n=1 Tax=Rubripirellula obstinata TaxID=406547 RepID=A0A5B1CQG7_9BACT|nr:translation initiation factor [Rubripirellula obstinata]KAA1262215.1 translation initiation factor Sui1 [Rubripirellula obstinata]